jgi:hypothetical protein
MSPWQWVLIALSAAGVVLAIVSIGIAGVAALRVSSRLEKLRESSFVTKLESLQIQVDRLTRISNDVEQLQTRAEAAVASLRATPNAAGIPELTAAWRNCALQLKAIAAELS